MENLTLIKLGEQPDQIEQSAAWFHSRWDVPVEAYRASMEQSVGSPASIPQWYVMRDVAGSIVAGMGIIENDFHQRKELTPNVCALYVEPAYRQQGVARQLLDTARREAALLGYSKIYLITDHTAFYEKCGWEFLTMVHCDGDTTERMYAASTVPK